jgi:chromosome segregation ATPase
MSKDYLLDDVNEKVVSLEKRIEFLEKKVGNLENRLTTVYGFISEIMKRLALMTVLQSTHRQKNAQIAEFVRNLEVAQRIIDLPANQDMDEIPF